MIGIRKIEPIIKFRDLLQKTKPKQAKKMLEQARKNKTFWETIII